MTRLRPPLLAGVLASVLAGALVAFSALGQTPPPAVTDPLPTTTSPDPVKPETPPIPAPSQSAPPGQPAAKPTAPALPTLVETPGETNDVDDVVLPAKPAAILSGRAKWEEAVPTLRGTFKRIEAELAKAGLAPAGRPLAVFAKTDDEGFLFEAMIPVASIPEPKPVLGDEVRLGSTPSGRALRFNHKGSYDEIDGTYETLTAYLDAKDVVVQDRFIEEYATDLSDKSDDRLEVNIYALPR